MCGIVGFQGTFSAELLQQMNQSVAHRGPDGEGTVTFSSADQPLTGLGHRRLSIIDLSEAGRQPMTVARDPGGGMLDGLTLIFNGEIYNYRELRAELEQSCHVFRSATDSETLLHLYERDGLAMLARLNGIFAFAIHDARPHGRPEGVSRGALFLARDQIGVKPLYYATTPRGVLFASEIKALLCAPDLSREIDPVALHRMLAFLWTPSPATTLAAVKKVPPGCAMIADGGKVVRQWRYYDPPYEGVRGDTTFQQTAEEVASRVDAAVRRQLVADVPVGAYLSGGLDSSAIVAMMRRASPERRPTCFTVALADHADDGSPDDLPYARQVASHLDVDLVEVTVEPSAIQRLPELVAILDEPQADPAPINALMIAERARGLGIPVLLSGAGGDDLFGGYRRHRAVSFERFWGWLPGQVRGGLEMLAGATADGAASGQNRPALRRLAKVFLHAGETADRRLASHMLWSTERLRRGIYTADFADRVRDVDTIEPLLESLSRIPNERDPLQRMLFLETKHFLADHNLNYTDRAGMATGVEVRVPLLDLDVVRLATRVPSSYKQRGSVGKAVFKKAMEPYLPANVIYRPKTGFGAPLRRWLRCELQSLVYDTLSPDALMRRGYFDPAAVRRLIDMDKAGRVDGSYTIFALMCVELWCRRFLDS
jgi:asparagine synthase (glutamine-hydrolysing)